LALPLPPEVFSRYGKQRIMEKATYDPYYRDLPSNVMPARTPFTRPGQRDAGHVFIYMTHKWKRWSLLLDKTCVENVYEEARLYIPRGFAQLLLLEKRYSTLNPKIFTAQNLSKKSKHAQTIQPPEPGRPFVVLREPIPSDTPQGDVLSYHLEEAAAITAAETYTRQHHRRAVVGLLLWDTMWL
jgi:hypothetical protein